MSLRGQPAARPAVGGAGHGDDRGTVKQFGWMPAMAGRENKARPVSPVSNSCVSDARVIPCCSGSRRSRPTRGQRRGGLPPWSGEGGGSRIAAMQAPPASPAAPFQCAQRPRCGRGRNCSQAGVGVAPTMATEQGTGPAPAPAAIALAHRKVCDQPRMATTLLKLPRLATSSSSYPKSSRGHSRNQIQYEIASCRLPTIWSPTRIAASIVMNRLNATEPRSCHPLGSVW